MFRFGLGLVHSSRKFTTPIALSLQGGDALTTVAIFQDLQHARDAIPCRGLSFITAFQTAVGHAFELLTMGTRISRVAISLPACAIL